MPEQFLVTKVLGRGWMLQSERLFDSNGTNTDFETVKSNSISKELHQKVTHLVDLEADCRVTRSSNRVNGEFS